MTSIHIDDRVRLRKAVPNLWLPRGVVGVVKSIWDSPDDACEVEFSTPDSECGTRALVPAAALESASEQSDS